jgi:hypothetical protein
MSTAFRVDDAKEIAVDSEINDASSIAFGGVVDDVIVFFFVGQESHSTFNVEFFFFFRRNREWNFFFFFSTEAQRDFTKEKSMSSLQSTPPLNRLDSLESPLRRYSGRRVMHIDLPASPAAVSSVSSSVSSPSVTSSSSMSPSVKTKSARQLQFASPPAVKRSRSVENSDDDEFALAVASDACRLMRRLFAPTMFQQPLL